MSEKNRKNSTSLMSGVMKSPTMSAEQKLALEMSADKSRGNSKIPAKKSAQTPVVLDATSVKYAELLIARVGSKSAVKATEESAVLSFSKEFAFDLTELDFTVSSRTSADFVILRSEKSRKIVQCMLSLDDLTARLPERERAQRASGIKFQFVVTPVDTFYVSYLEDVEFSTLLRSVDFNKSTRTGRLNFDDFSVDIVTKSRIEVYPSRFNANGEYIPARKSKSGSSDSNPEREIYVVVLDYADGSFEILRDQGITNLIPKVLRRLSKGIVNAQHNPDELYVWTPAEDDDDAEDDDAEDSDE